MTKTAVRIPGLPFNGFITVIIVIVIIIIIVY